jgi:glycerol-3-phosphate O-acyltransferase
MNRVSGFLVSLASTLLHPFLRRIQFLEEARQTLAPLYERGQVIFVSQSVSFIDFLVLRQVLRSLQMPQVVFSHGFSPFLYQGLLPATFSGLSNLFHSRDVVWRETRAHLMRHIAEGSHGLVFLKRSRAFGSKLEYYSGLFGPLCQYAATAERPVFLVPLSIFLTRRRKNKLRTTWEILFGTYDTPGRFRKITQLLLVGPKGMALFSKPVELSGVLQQDPFKESDEEKREKGLRRLLLWHLNNEDRAYRGPTKKSVEQKIHSILKDKRLRQQLEAVAERQNRSMENVLREARKNLNEMASDTSEKVINLLRLLFDFVWARTLEGIDYSTQDFNRMRELNKTGSIVFLPCHRSHVDYLVFAYLFEKVGLNNPRIAAGDNLSSWPLGPILRRAGAFFIRRSFKGEAVFPLVFEAYLRQILKRGLNLVFFMEGGRSRTGKLLNPKLGMLKMVFDAWQKGDHADLPLVPITIDYGKVFEGKSYISETSGGEKVREDIRGLLKTPKVLLRKHGVIRIRFGAPLSLRQFVSDQGFSPETLDYKNKLPLVQTLAMRVMNQINQMVTITAGNVLAGILMAHPRGGMTLKDLRALFVITSSFLVRRKVELAFPEKNLDAALQHALDTFRLWETVETLEVSGETIVRIPSEKRPEMEYYKNNGLHFILDVALVATAMRTLDGVWTLPAIRQRAQELHEWLSHEFLVEAPYPDEKTTAQAVKAIADRGGLVVEGETVRLGSQKLGRDLYRVCTHLLLNYLESYFVTLDMVIQNHAQMPLAQKELIKSILARAQLLLAVGTLRMRESINKVSFENALYRLSRMGMIQFRSESGQKTPQITVRGSRLGDLERCRDLLFSWLNAIG